MSLKLPRWNVGLDDQPGVFNRYWNTAMKSIEENVNGLTEALAAAVAAQGTADGATISAASAQAMAVSANANANTRVLKSAGPAWVNATGTASRTAYSTYGGQTVSNPPTQAQVQQIDDAVVALSQHVVALINDLKNNQSLT